MTTPIEPELVDFHYIQKRYSIGRNKAYQLLREGKIKAVRLLGSGRNRGRTLIVLESLQEYLADLTTYDFNEVCRPTVPLWSRMKK
jgi:hypothetical protein